MVLRSDTIEFGAGVSWYFDKHNHKLQADYRELEFENAPNTDAKEFRVQLQMIF